jgi:hypothetical protein
VLDFIDKTDAVGVAPTLRSVGARARSGRRHEQRTVVQARDRHDLLPERWTRVGGRDHHSTRRSCRSCAERNANARHHDPHTIGLSAAHDSVLLRRLAEENGGQYVGR